MMTQSSELNTQPPPFKPNHSYKLWLSLILIMIIGCFGYTRYLEQELQKQLEQNRTTLNDEFNQFLSKQQTLESLIQNLDTKHQSEQEQLRINLRTLRHQIDMASSPLNDISTHLLLLKARYTLELAQLNAIWSTERDTTIALLEEADHLLSPLHIPDLIQIRLAIAEDLLSQRTAPKIDETHVLTQLDAIQQLITTYRFDPPTLPKPIEETPLSTDITELKTWQQRLRVLTQTIKQFFIVRYRPDPLQPLITPAYKTMQRETIRLSLQEAQWALLQRNEPSYQFALAQASKHLEFTFEETDPTLAILLKQLDNLKNIHVQFDKIIPTTSLDRLNQLISKNLERPTPIDPSFQPALSPIPTSMAPGVNLP